MWRNKLTRTPLIVSHAVSRSTRMHVRGPYAVWRPTERGVATQAALPHRLQSLTGTGSRRPKYRGAQQSADVDATDHSPEARQRPGGDGDLRRELAEAEAQLLDLTERQLEAKQVVDALRSRLDEAGAPSVDSAPGPVAPARTPEQKVALFRSLFRGRADVYPRLWVNPKNGAKGYSPACGNEWVRGDCEKPRVKCGECQHQAFLPFDDDAILGHLQGRPVMGIYPMLEDETCWFLAADFDKGNWMQDVEAFLATCREFDVPAAIERSRSGNGAHVWIFFAAPVPAAVARTMGCILLTETMARRHELPLSSCDRFFPNQDTIPRGGFGNLIALPLQHQACASGNTASIVEFQLGPVRHTMNAKGLAGQRQIRRLLVPRETDWCAADALEQPKIQDIYRQLATDDDRNRLIVDDLIQALEEGRSPILLTERRDHLEFFEAQLSGVVRNLVVLRGGVGQQQRLQCEHQLASVPTDQERLILATGRFIGEGFDDARLDTLFLAMPVSWKGTLVQYAGRLHRQSADKGDVRVFDYVDRRVPMLARMFERRLRGYRSMGYTVAASEVGR